MKSYHNYFKGIGRSLFLSVIFMKSLCYGQGLFPISAKTGCGYINVDGQEVVAPIHQTCPVFDTLAWGKLQTSEGWRIVNDQGQFLTTSFKQLEPYTNQIYIGRKTNTIHFIHLEQHQSKEIYTCDSFQTVNIKEEEYLQLYQKGYSFLIDKRGQHYLRKLHISSFQRVSDDCFIVAKNGLMGVCNLEGEYYLMPKYDSIKHDIKGLMLYRNGLMGYKRTLSRVHKHTKKHQEIFITPIYTKIKYFGEDYMFLQKENKVHLYDIDHQKVIVHDFPPNAIPFTKNRHLIRENKKYGLLDKHGKVLLTPTYDKIIDSKLHQYTICRQNGLYGLLDKHGKELLPPTYDRIYRFQSYGVKPRYFTKYRHQKLFGLLSSSGDTICGAKYLNIRMISNDRAACVNRDSSARVFMVDPNTGEFEDWYDLKNVALLSIKKSIVSVGRDNLFKKLEAPAHQPYRTFGLYNRETNGGFRVDKEMYYDIKLSDINKHRVARTAQLIDDSFHPLDTEYTLISSWNKNVYGKSYGDMEMLRSAKLIRAMFFDVVDMKGKRSILDLKLKNFVLLFDQNGIKSHQRVVDYSYGNRYYPTVFKTLTFGKRTNYVIPKKGLDGYYAGAGYDSLIVNERNIVGRQDTIWTSIYPLRNRLPTHTLEVSLADSIMLVKKFESSYYLFSATGKRTHKFKEITLMKEGDNLVLAKLDTAYNYIQSNGELLLDTNVVQASPFVNGFASIRKGDYFQIINTKGEVISQNQYRKAIRFNEKGIAIFRKGRKYGLMDTLENIVDSAIYAKIDQVYKSSLFLYKQEGLAPYRLMNAKGEKLGKEEFIKVKLLKGQTLLAQSHKGYGLVNNISGEILIDAKYTTIKPISEDMFMVMKKNKWGVVNQKGEWLLPIQYQKIGRLKKLGYAEAKGKKGVVYILRDGTVKNEKPAPTRIEKEQSRPSLTLIREGGYVGLASPFIAPQYHHIILLENGAYMAFRKYTFDIGYLNGTILAHSDEWLTANLLSHKIVQVKDITGIHYYNITQQKWVR